MMRGGLALLVGLATTLGAAALGADPAPRSATEFLSDALKREQADLSANRGSLWVDQGRALWAATPAGTEGKACASCHGDLASTKGVATRYPAADAASGQLLTLEMRVNTCRTRHQRQPALAPETDDLLALTAALAVQSRGMAVDIAIDGAAGPAFEAGRAWFNTRQGQLNLACSQCHVDNVGGKLRGDTISSGLGTGYPAYRLEWNGLGSLHRRLRACQIGVRAVDLPFGSPEHVALELYLAWRARGTAIEAPAIRR